MQGTTIQNFQFIIRNYFTISDMMLHNLRRW